MSRLVRESQGAVLKARFAIVLLGAVAIVLLLRGPSAYAQQPPPEQAEAAAGEQAEEPQQEADQAEDAKVEMKPTEIGVRFTPRMAQAMSKQFARQMKDRYELNDQQTDEIRDIISTKLMKVVSENAATGRDTLEMMMETVIENDGRFPKESAQEFAKLTKPLIPALRDFFTQTSAAVGRKMTMKQRLKFTADAAAATAGLVIFENRMKRWEEGKVGDGANPFWDPADQNPEAETQPTDDPTERSEHRQARQGAEQQIRWALDVESRWGEYVDQAITFYEFDEAQTNAAKAILADVLGRAKAVKTPQWETAVKENRIAQRLSWSAGGAQFAQGPWMFKLDSQYDQLTKPLFDMGKELRRRIEDLPNSAQRAKALEKVRKALSEKGLERLPV